MEDVGLGYAESRISNRQMDTLIGISKGIISDGVVSQSEAEFLLNWLANNQFTDSLIFDQLLIRIYNMLRDGHLDKDEQTELFQYLVAFVGDPGSLGEILKSTTLPLDDPQPEVDIEGNTFAFTGTCAYGTRKQCREFVEERGGITLSNVTRQLDYLVIGTYVTKSWMHESYGRKIEKAMEYREMYGLPSVISEQTLGMFD